MKITLIFICPTSSTKWAVYKMGINFQCLLNPRLVLLVLCAGDSGDTRSPTTIYLTHMALADLLFLSTIPLSVIDMVQQEFTMSQLICTYKIFAQHMNQMVSIAMLTLLSSACFESVLFDHLFEDTWSELVVRNHLFETTCSEPVVPNYLFES